MTYAAGRHHRRSIRLKGYDYAQAGAYFATLCVEGRDCMVGRICDNVMVLNDAGPIVDECWRWLASRYNHVELDAWVVMLNHLHGIIVLTDDQDEPQGVAAQRRGGSRTAPTTTTASKRKPLGRLIGAFNTVSTKRINALRGTPGVRRWQRNYFERIIRDDPELIRIRRYIIENPLRWGLDRNNPYR